MDASWAAWVAIAIGIFLNVVGLVYSYGRQTSKLEAMKEIISENERRLDRIQTDIREVRLLVMGAKHPSNGD